jgi:hypothetical protein
MLLPTLRTPQHLADETIFLAALFTRDHVACMCRTGIYGTLPDREEGIVH